MSGFEVDVDGLRLAAGAAASAGEQAKQVHLGEGATEVAAAMPGSVSATKAEPLGTVWDQRLSTWGDDVGTFSSDLTATADHYAANEDAAEQDFSLFGWVFG
jgi:hypothetical protein